ncbi:hypothetical protein AB0C34_17490 [Nocardia sp. NPDC049220]|uniref:hypothetical protein n=1 Tax=Nocardia sp. NPDC049220 TaxID=3155273 RepID=UPI00340B7F0F
MNPISELLKLRYAELMKLSKAELVAMRLRGVTDPQGRTVRSLPQFVGTDMSKDRLVDDILNIEFPPPGANDSTI